MKFTRNFLVILLLTALLAAVGYIYVKDYLLPRRHVVQDSTVVMEKVQKVLKLVTVEGQFSEIHQHTEYYGYDISPLRKKALIRVNARVLVGYDLDKMNLQIDEKARTLYLDAFPNPELLSIDDDIEYYDVTEGLFTSFSTSDYNALQKIAKAKIVEAAETSGLFEKAAEQKSDMLDLLKLTLESIGWELKVKQQPVLMSQD